jgi:exodeoxyribonuclease VII small subunit
MTEPTKRAPASAAPAEAPGLPADDSLGYEAAREELLDVVRRLEQGGTTLEESLELWERGERLARICQSWLDGARARLETALGDGEGATGGR